MKKIYLILVFSFFYNFPITSQNVVDAFFVEGLGSDESVNNNNCNLNHYRMLLESMFPLDPQCVGYNSTEDINNAVNTLHSNLNNNHDPNDAIGIGVSFGGLTFRKMLAEQQEGNISQKVGGIVTIATPNNGAFLANNVIDGTAEETIGNWLKDILLGPLSAILGPVPTFIADQIFGLENLLPFHSIVNMFGVSQESQTVQDISVGSGVLHEMQQNIPNDPIAQILTKENNEILWRTIRSSQNSNEVFGDHDDTEILGTVNTLENTYRVIKNSFYAASAINGILAFFTFGVTAPAAVKAGIIGYNFKKGEDVFAWKAVSEWNSLVGRYNVEFAYAPHQVCTANWENIFSTATEHNVEDCLHMLNQNIPTTDLPASCNGLVGFEIDCEIQEVFTPILLEPTPNDGVVPTLSQKIPLTDNHNNIITLDFIEHTNHIETANSPELQAELERLFKGEAGDPDEQDIAILFFKLTI